MLARNFALAALTAAILFAAGFGIGLQHNGQNKVNTSHRSFSHSVIPAPPNTTRAFSFIHSVFPSRDSERSSQAKTQDNRASDMRSGFGNSK